MHKSQLIMLQKARKNEEKMIHKAYYNILVQKTSNNFYVIQEYENMWYLYENTSVLFTKTCDSHKYFDYKIFYKEHFFPAKSKWIYLNTYKAAGIFKTGRFLSVVCYGLMILIC